MMAPCMRGLATKALLLPILTSLLLFPGLGEERETYQRVRSLSLGSGDYRTDLYILGKSQDGEGINIMVQGCIHGDEVSGREAGRTLIDAFEEGRLELNGLILYVIPELNRPACRAGIRNFYPGADAGKKSYLRSDNLINMSRAWPTDFDKDKKTYVGGYKGRDYTDAESIRTWHPPEIVEASIEIAKFVREEVIPFMDGTSPYHLPRMDAVFCLHSVTYNMQYAGINLEGEVSSSLYPEAVRIFKEEEIVGPEHAIPGDDCYFANSALGIYGIIIDVPTNKPMKNGTIIQIPLEQQREETLRYLIGMINRVIPDTEKKSDPESPWAKIGIRYKE